MTAAQVCRSLFLLTLLTAVAQIKPSLHGHNDAFTKEEREIQYLLDGLPISMHKDFPDSVHGTGDTTSEENEIVQDNVQDSVPQIDLEPQILDFKKRQLGVPHQETVTVFNRDDNRTVYLSSITGNTLHFHSSFFQDKVIPPLGNTTFNVVLLGREEGEIDSHLLIHTSEGTIKYKVKGVSVGSQYRLRSIVGVKLPINTSFNPLLYMHNPHAYSMQVLEVYSSGREFQLELPSGNAAEPLEMWEIGPYQTKPVVRLKFSANVEKNHTAYVRFRVNISSEVLIAAVEIEVTNGAGLHWGDSSGVVNFGLGGSFEPPTRYHITLKNSAKKPIKVQNIISTPTSNALKIDFEPTTIPGDTDSPVKVGTLFYDWKAGLDLKHFKGKLMIKGIGQGGSSQKLAIPWLAEVLQGGLEVNISAAHYCSPQSSEPRNFSVVNKFTMPLAITNVFLPPDASSRFYISNFAPKILKSGQRHNIFMLAPTYDITDETLQFESSIIIHSNVSITEVPLLSYNGKLRKIIPNERESDKGSINFGTVSSDTDEESIFALENQNPVSIELHDWGVNMPGAVLELIGCQNGPTDLFNRGLKNITACNVTGNQSIKPGYLAVFKIKVKTPNVEEDTIVGDVFVKTKYERLTVPVYMRVAHGKISVKRLMFTDCFPGSLCVQPVKIHSTFARPMEVTFIKSMHKDERMKYIPLEETSYPIISKGDNHVGSIVIDPSVTCKQNCYLGLSLNNNVGSQWLNTLSLPSHTRDSDLNLLNTLYTRYLNTTSASSWDNVTMQLDTSEVRGHKFTVSIKQHWPSLLRSSSNHRNKSLVSFPLTQVGNTSYKSITLHNPSTNPLLVQLVMDWSYPQAMRLFQSLPEQFKPPFSEYFNAIQGEFKLNDNVGDKNLFEREHGIPSAQNTIPLILQPHQSKTINLSYTPKFATSSSAFLYIRNNMTILEVLRFVGRGAYAHLKIGNRKPGSPKPLLFEFTEKHLQDCEAKFEDLQTKSKDSKDDEDRSGVFRREPNLTLKRSFMARNTGELPIEVRGFYINGLTCEGYGFKVLNCEPFTLQPNTSHKIEIAFTPDFTLSRIERDLFIETSMGRKTPNEHEHEHEQEQEEEDEGDELEPEADGMVKLNLLTTIPSNKLEACASILVRPNWEHLIHYAAIVIAGILLIGVMITGFFEADRILNVLLLSMSRGNPTQPPLDLRLLSHSSPMQQQHGIHTNLDQQSDPSNSKEKLVHTTDESSSNRTSSKSNNKKDDRSPSSSPLPWNLVSSKRGKDKSGLKQHQPLADWSVEEERRFRLDSEARDGLKRSVDSASLSLEPTYTSSGGGGSKKRGGKQQQQQRHSLQDAPPSDNVADATAAAEMQLATSEKKSSNKSSPSSNRKPGKNSKEEPAKPVDHEAQVDAASYGLAGVKDSAKQEASSKRKQSSISNNGSSQNAALRKYEANASQKVAQYSEEETSSTTTESSIQDDTKDCENNSEKSDKAQRKSGTKKSKSTQSSSSSSAGVPSLDYKDTYEDDCDDDDYYDKDKQEDADNDNPNRWKTSPPRASGKNQLVSRSSVEAAAKLPRQKQSPPKKEKASQKKRNTEKSQSKAVTTVTTTTTATSSIAAAAATTATVLTPAAITASASVTAPREETTRPPVVIPATVSPSPLLQTSPIPHPQPHLPPPPAVCWGENRAKFSDVVARNQDNSSPFGNQSSNINNDKSHKTIGCGTSSMPGIFHFLEGTDCANRQPNQERSLNEYKFGLKNAEAAELSGTASGILGIQSNSYFSNTFSESTCEPKLIPFDDFHDTDEPLMELEHTEENSHSEFWQGNNPIARSFTESSVFPEGTRTSTKKVSNLSDSLQDNWVTAEPSYKPTRGAVGEERSSACRINTGGVWAAAPWGARLPPPTLQSTILSQTRESSVQENTGYDPFTSLSTIWSPSSTDIWKTNKNNDHVNDTH